MSLYWIFFHDLRLQKTFFHFLKLVMKARYLVFGFVLSLPLTKILFPFEMKDFDTCSCSALTLHHQFKAFMGVFIISCLAQTLVPPRLPQAAGGGHQHPWSRRLVHAGSQPRRDPGRLGGEAVGAHAAGRRLRHAWR